MVRLYKITTWVVICLSFLALLLFLCAPLLVGLAGHSSGSNVEIAMPIIYCASLFVSLRMTQRAKKKNKYVIKIAQLILLIGIGFCLYGFYEDYGYAEGVVSLVFLILLLITFIGLIKAEDS